MTMRIVKMTMPMSFSVDELARIAMIFHTDRSRLDYYPKIVLINEAHQSKDVLGRRFALEGHPRLEAIARAGDVVRFPADSDLPDPATGDPGHESLKSMPAGESRR